MERVRRSKEINIVRRSVLASACNKGEARAAFRAVAAVTAPPGLAAFCSLPSALLAAMFVTNRLPYELPKPTGPRTGTHVIVHGARR
jgi:hypothetical protein